MKIIAVDDEKLILCQIKEMLESLGEVTNVACFDNPYEALDYAHSHEIDLAFLDVEMPVMSGIDLARRLTEISEDIKIVFITGYSQYAYDAFKVSAIDYIVKPYLIDDLKKSINKAKRILKSNRDVRVNIRTFGRFDVFVDNQLLLFPSSKSKELFALLVDAKGGSVTMEQAITYLWEDRDYDDRVKRLYRAAIIDLRKTLENHDLSDIINVTRANIFLDISKVECDYYAFLQKNKDAISSYNGEYMFEYSWAEKTNAAIDEWFERNTGKNFGIK